MAIRALLLVGFICHLSYQAQAKHNKLWICYYLVICIMYIAGVVIYLGEQGEQEHMAIRTASIYAEFFGLPVLILQQVYLYFSLKSKQLATQLLSLEVIAEREAGFAKLFGKFEARFLDLHEGLEAEEVKKDAAEES